VANLGAISGAGVRGAITVKPGIDCRHGVSEIRVLYAARSSQRIDDSTTTNYEFASSGQKAPVVVVQRVIIP
jgi:hypothetical protein